MFSWNISSGVFIFAIFGVLNDDLSGGTNMMTLNDLDPQNMGLK